MPSPGKLEEKKMARKKPVETSHRETKTTNLVRNVYQYFLTETTEIVNSFKWEIVSHCCLISAKVRYCGADGEEVWYD